MTTECVFINITGIVQGVGFRPFVYSLATRLGLVGWVRNTSAGVEILVEGNPVKLQEFSSALRSDIPPLARIDTLQVEAHPVNVFQSFEIHHSAAIAEAFQPISPDVATCTDCLRELFDPTDRRYRYPFTNCTNCGPRFTIIEDIPYDRPKTTMAGFPLCPQCAAEYENPLDRRFHAQPVACPTCGPQIWLEYPAPHTPHSAPDSIQTALPSTPDHLAQEHVTPLPHPAPRTPHFLSDSALLETQRLLFRGKIVAIKGLGGFHLACDATNRSAVSELRQRKLRVDKPFALMMPDLATVKLHCFASQMELDLLASRARPIVILPRRPDSSVAREVAPGQNDIGVMLPYSPLHHLLFRPNPLVPDETPAQVLVMTSGNLSEEPIAVENEEARQRLSALADAFLMHNRPIRTRCDDSVVRIVDLSSADSVQLTLANHETGVPDTGSRDTLLPLRRSRGYAPFPVRLPWDAPPLLATGAELKNTFCLTRGHYAFLSHHIGDMENYETLQSFEDSVEHYARLFRVDPQAVAYDLHPNYLATRYALNIAETRKLPAYGVQHHHAHIVACMVEHNLPDDQPVLGVAFDGTGYGDDGAIWGGEFLLADYRAYRRLAHLAYIPLPGGDAAIRRPARIALAHCWQAGLEWEAQLPPVQALCADELHALRNQLEHRINTPLTSSMGRLFDAAAALVGGRQKVNYEAQAAIEFETLADPAEQGSYPFAVTESDPGFPVTLSPTPLFSALVRDLQAGVPAPTLSARFHNGVAEMVHQVALQLCRQHNLKSIVLSGGVWQNCTLLAKTINLLGQESLKVYYHEQVPPNDGGLALGQAVIGLHALKP